MSAAGTAPATDMVTIAAGEYAIGSDSGPPVARPRHLEKISAFRIERTEVTVAAYNEFVVATHAPAPWPGAVPVGTLPVTRVPWGDAANFCAWKHHDGGRLPTEIEWEAAARGTAARAYPYGDSADAASANTASARRAGPVPVGSFPRGATPEGLQDMSVAARARDGAVPRDSRRRVRYQRFARDRLDARLSQGVVASR
jgi:iron(II)-dependent oxidoreductase